jgi:hypothetical protein
MASAVEIAKTTATATELDDWRRDAMLLLAL